MVCNMLLKKALEIDGLQHVAEASFGDRWFAAYFLFSSGNLHYAKKHYPPGNHHASHFISLI